MHLTPLILVVVTLSFSGIDGGADQLNAKTRKSCPPVKCPGGKPKQCAYGYQKKDGCEICRCDDPCNPPGKAILCGPKQRCFIDKNGDGTFIARCDNSSQTTKPNKNNKKNKKGNKHAKSAFIIATSHGSNTRELDLSPVDSLIISLGYILLSLCF